MKETDVRCSFCGKIVKEEGAEKVVSYVGTKFFGADIEEKVENYFCCEEHVALYLYEEHFDFYGLEDRAFSHLEEAHRIGNIRKLVRAYETGEQLPDIEFKSD